MTSSTRARLTEAAAALFAAQGYRGTSVRDICNQARANPGAVSYHFGGKRQLYRTVLRQVAERLAGAVADDEKGGPTAEPDAVRVLRRTFRRINADPAAARLLLRDLADGGELAVEALEPSLRTAFDSLTTSIGAGDRPGGGPAARRLFLELAAPVFLLTAGWPLVARTLDVGPGERERVFDELAARLVERLDYDTGSTF